MEKENKGILEGRSEWEKVRIYLAIVLVLVVLAVAVTLAVPRSHGAKSCLSILLEGSRDSCLLNLALYSKNSTVCGYLPKASSDSCYSAIAKESLNASTCTKISNYNGSAECVTYVANATDSPGTCSLLNGSQRSDCIEALAVRLGDTASCSMISNSTEAMICASSVYFSEAVNNQNSSYCKAVTNTTDHVSVIKILTVSGSVTNTSSSSQSEFLGLNPLLYLESEGYSYSAKDLCYYSVASTLGSQSSCRDISNKSLEVMCNSSTSKSTGISNLSENTTGLYSLCIKYSSGNVATCNALVNITRALGSENVSYCSSLSSQAFRNQCYASLARAYRNASYCGYISNSTVNSACVEDINYNVT